MTLPRSRPDAPKTGVGGFEHQSEEEYWYIWRSHSILMQAISMLGIPEKDRVQIIQRIDSLRKIK